MNTESTVQVDVLEDYQNALLMTWSGNPSQHDVQMAFELIRHHLNHANHTIHIIVDIRANPTFPLGETLHGALKPQSHAKMGRWLVIGSNRLAKFIAQAISSFQKSNIEWMADETAAYERLDELIAEKI